MRHHPPCVDCRPHEDLTAWHSQPRAWAVVSSITAVASCSATHARSSRLPKGCSRNRASPLPARGISELCARGARRPSALNAPQGRHGCRSAIVFAFPVLRTCFRSWTLSTPSLLCPRRRNQRHAHHTSASSCKRPLLQCLSSAPKHGSWGGPLGMCADLQRAASTTAMRLKIFFSPIMSRPMLCMASL